MKRPADAIPSAILFLVLVAFGAPRIGSAQYTSDNRDVLTPNTGAWPQDGVSLGGTTFINLGLQGVGRIPSTSLDPATGESLGSISDMQITEWKNNGNGTYEGIFNFLPDRGFNSGTTFSNYAARINEFSFTFTPYTLPAATTQQNQISFTKFSLTRFTYAHDNDTATPPVFTTGLLATSSVPVFGATAPASGVSTTIGGVTMTNRLTLDSEGLAFDPRGGRAGSGWIGDEYGAYVYHFDKNKQIDGVLPLPEATLPHSPAGTLNFAADPRRTGGESTKAWKASLSTRTAPSFSPCFRARRFRIQAAETRAAPTPVSSSMTFPEAPAQAGRSLNTSFSSPT